MKIFFGIVAIAIIGVIILGMAGCSAVVNTWNTLNAKFQATKGAESSYSAALNICTQKIKGVWEIANQYMKHESETFKGVAAARSGYTAAEDAFKQAQKTGASPKELTQRGDAVVQAALAFRIQIEAYPQLMAVQTSKDNIRNMQEAVEQINTAIGDWIFSIKSYNTYRGSAMPSIIGSFMTKFPSEIPYYEGKVKELNIDTLNPEKSK